MKCLTAIIRLDRNLNLLNQKDKNYIINAITQNPDLKSKLSEIVTSIDTISNYLDLEWLVVYPPIVCEPIISVKIGAKNHDSLHFFSEVIPLGLALKRLENHHNFHRLIQKLRTHSHEKINAWLEAITALKYLDLGYEVELEPSNQKGGLCDLRILSGTDWIYLECKVENHQDSKYFKSRIDFAERRRK